MADEKIEETLESRDKYYGPFLEVAKTTTLIKTALELNRGDYTSVQREALSMIAVKLARIVNGDRTLIDNWHDIAGYATLVELDLEANQSSSPGRKRKRRPKPSLKIDYALRDAFVDNPGSNQDRDHVSVNRTPLTSDE